jgi:hypothetical protein
MRVGPSTRAGQVRRVPFAALPPAGSFRGLLAAARSHGASFRRVRGALGSRAATCATGLCDRLGADFSAQLRDTRSSHSNSRFGISDSHAAGRSSAWTRQCSADWAMSEHDDTAESEPDPTRWDRLRGWAKEHRTSLTVVGVGVTAFVTAFALRAATRYGTSVETPRVTSAAPPLADAAKETAARASSRVAKEFEALSRAYKNSAMDQTVKDAVRRHQRWTPEELEVLADTGKTAVEKAVELKRTFNGVMAKSIEQGLSSKAP